MHLRPITRADLPTLVSITTAAFAEDWLFHFLLPGRQNYPSDFYDWVMQRQRSRMTEPGTWGVVCVSDADDDMMPAVFTSSNSNTNTSISTSTTMSTSTSTSTHKEEILGYAWWKRKTPASGPTHPSGRVSAAKNTTFGAALERALEAAQNRYHAVIRPNRAASAANVALFSQEQRGDDFLAPLREHWHLAMLAVAPAHQRKGVGGCLLDWGIERARAEGGVPMTLTASPSGVGLYRKKGFRIMDAMRIPGEETGDPAMVLDLTGEWVRLVLGEGEEKIVKLHVKMEAVWTDKAMEGLTDAELAGLPQNVWN